jgi:hypothetical protein
MSRGNNTGRKGMKRMPELVPEEDVEKVEAGIPDDWEETIQTAEEHVPWPEEWPQPIEMRAYLLRQGLSEEEADTIVQSFDDMLQGRGVVLYRPPKGETDENLDRG